MASMPQPMRPHGTTGRIFGFLMERLSAPNYRWVLAELEAHHPQSYLEIGFGTGKLAFLVARKLKPARVVGVDPSELMVKLATQKLEPFTRDTAIDLKCGDDTLLSSLAAPFDAIAATHSFQFWRNPMATLARVHALIAPDGLFVLVLRKHISGKIVNWIPNPITKSGDEIGGARRALTDAGFRVLKDAALRTGSHGFVAAKKEPEA